MASRAKLNEWVKGWTRWQSGQNPRARVPSAVTVLDIEGGSLRVVQSNGRGEINLVLSEPLELAPEADRGDAAIVGAAVGKALTKLKLQPNRVVMGVPRGKAVLRTLTVPVVDKIPELTSLVHLQVGKDLPFRIEEAVLDFQIIRRVEPNVTDSGAADPDKSEIQEPGAGGLAGGVSNSATVSTASSANSASSSTNASSSSSSSSAAAAKMEVLVAAVKREVVEFYQAVASAAGTTLAGLGLLPAANARCVAACEATQGDESVVLVSLRPDEVGVDVLAREKLLFSRGAIIRPGLDTASPPNSAAREAFQRSVAIEVVRSLHGHSGMESGSPVTSVWVAGGTGHEAVVASNLSARLGTPAQVLDPAAKLKLPATVSDAAAGAMGAMGLALSANDATGLPFDFLHPKEPLVVRDLRRLWWIGSAAVSTLVLVGLMALRATLIQRRTATYNSAVEELADAEKKRPMYRRQVQQTAVVDEWIKGGRDWLQQYAYLTSILPPSEELYVNSLAISGQGQIRMAVQARNGETLARLEQQLREAGYDVKPFAITPGADRFGYESRSTVEITPTAKQLINLHKVKPAPRPLDDVSLEPAAYRRGGGG